MKTMFCVLFSLQLEKEYCLRSIDSLANFYAKKDRFVGHQHNVGSLLGHGHPKK